MTAELITTARLELRRMSAEFLEASLAGLTDMEGIGVIAPAEWLAETQFIKLRREQYRTEPGYATWGVWAMVRRDPRQMIGHIGFHTTPNAEYLRPYVRDAVEFGYAVYPEFRSQGFATEAARGLIEWATRAKQQRRFVMSISPANEHSQAIARKLGFVKIAEWEDEVDGTEEVFLLELPEPTNSVEG